MKDTRNMKVGEVMCEECQESVINALKHGGGIRSQDDIDWVLAWAADTHVMADLLYLALEGKVVLFRGDDDEMLFALAGADGRAASAERDEQESN